jgi:hypothetical protein
MNPFDQLRDRYGMNNDEILEMIKEKEESPESLLIEDEIEDINQRISASLETKQRYSEDSFNYKRAVIRLNCYHLFKNKLQRIEKALKSDSDSFGETEQ